jgi:hypothetical protein
MGRRLRRRGWWGLVALGLAGPLALAGCGKDIQLDRSSLEDLYGTDHEHADCVATKLEHEYSDKEIEQIDKEVRAIQTHEKTPDQASDLFHRFDADLHTAAVDCGIDTGDTSTTVTASGASTTGTAPSPTTSTAPTTATSTARAPGATATATSQA